MQAHAHRGYAQRPRKLHEHLARAYASKSQALRGIVRRQMKQQPFNQLVVPPPPGKPRLTELPPVAAENGNACNRFNAVVPAR
jgi:hypothetical protein